MDENSLAHTKWNCKYHVVFAPKFRRKIIYNQLRADIGKIIRMLCERKGIKIIEAEVCPDHIHMLILIPPKMSVSGAIGQERKQNNFRYLSNSNWKRSACVKKFEHKIVLPVSCPYRA